MFPRNVPLDVHFRFDGGQFQLRIHLEAFFQCGSLRGSHSVSTTFCERVHFCKGLLQRKTIRSLLRFGASTQTRNRRREHKIDVVHQRREHGTNEIPLHIVTLSNPNKRRIDHHRGRKLDGSLIRFVLLQQAAEPKQAALPIHCEQCDPASQLQEGRKAFRSCERLQQTERKSKRAEERVPTPQS